MTWWMHLDKKRGSRPRCALLVDGPAEEVARRLTDLASLHGVSVSAEDRWMPYGKPVLENGQWNTDPSKEAKLGEADRLLPQDQRRVLREWWLATPDDPRANTPNWDIASTCTVGGEAGLLLVEAKAHRGELKEGDSCTAGEPNLGHIGNAVDGAGGRLDAHSGIGKWHLSHRTHYQLSNRFAWSWKLASMGIPVVLVYLGFLHAVEMEDQGEPFASADGWRTAVLEYSQGIVPGAAWNEQPIATSKAPFYALIRSIDIDFHVERAKFD